MVKLHKKSLKGGKGADHDLKEFQKKIKNLINMRNNNGDEDEREQAQDELNNILQGADSLHDFDVVEGHGRASNAHDALVALAKATNPSEAESLLAAILRALSKSDKVQGVDNKGKRDFSKGAIKELCNLEPQKSLTYEWGVTALMDDCGFLKLEQEGANNLRNNKETFYNKYGAGITWKTMIDHAKNQDAMEDFIKKINGCDIGNILVIHQGAAANGISWKDYRTTMKQQTKIKTSVECSAFRKVILSFLFPDGQADDQGVGFTYDAGASQTKQPTNVIFEKASINSNNNNGDFITVTPANMVDSAVAPRSYIPAGALQGSPQALSPKPTKAIARKLRLALDAFNSTQKKFIFPSMRPDSIIYEYNKETTFFSNKFGVKITLTDNGFGPNNPMGFDLTVESPELKFTIPYHDVSQMSILQGPSAPFLASMMWKKGVNTINPKGLTKDSGFSNQIVGVPSWENTSGSAANSPDKLLKTASKSKSFKAARGRVNEMWDSLLFDFKRSGDYEQIEAMIGASENQQETFPGVLCTVDILAALRARQMGLPAMLVGTGPSNDKYLICYRPEKSKDCDNDGVDKDAVSGLRGGKRGKIKINKIMKGGEVMTREQKARAEISHIRGITSFVKNMVISKISTILALPSNTKLDSKGVSTSQFLNANKEILEIKMAFQCYRIYYDILENLDNYFNRISTRSACVIDTNKGGTKRDYNKIQIDVSEEQNFLIAMMNIKKQVIGLKSNKVYGYLIQFYTKEGPISTLTNFFPSIHQSLNLIQTENIPKSTRTQRIGTINAYISTILTPIITQFNVFRLFLAQFSTQLWSVIINDQSNLWLGKENPLDAFNTLKLSDDFLDALKEMIEDVSKSDSLDSRTFDTTEYPILGNIYNAVVALGAQNVEAQDMLFAREEDQARFKLLNAQIVQYQNNQLTKQDMLPFINNLKFGISYQNLPHEQVQEMQRIRTNLLAQIKQETIELITKYKGRTLSPQDGLLLITLLENEEAQLNPDQKQILENLRDQMKAAQDAMQQQHPQQVQSQFQQQQQQHSQQFQQHPQQVQSQFQQQQHSQQFQQHPQQVQSQFQQPSHQGYNTGNYNNFGGGAKKRIMQGGANQETELLFTLCIWDNLFNLDFSPFEYLTSPDSTKLNFIRVGTPNTSNLKQTIFGDGWVLPNTSNNTFTLDGLNDMFIAYMNASMSQLSATATTKNIALSLGAQTTTQHPLNGPYLLNFPYTKPDINRAFLGHGLPNNKWPLFFSDTDPTFQGYCHDGVIVYFPRMGRTYLNNCDLLTSGGTNQDRIKQQGILKYVLVGDTSDLRGGRKRMRKKETRKRKKRKYKTLRRRKKNRKRSLKRKKRKKKTKIIK